MTSTIGSNYISISVKKNKSYPSGCFNVVLMIDGKYKTSKDANLNVHEPELAYEMVTFWADERIKEYPDLKITYTQTPLKDLLYRLEQKGEVKPKIDLASSTSLSNLFKNKGYFRAALKGCHKEHGMKRCIEIMQDGLDHLDVWEKDFQEVNKTRFTAIDTMANTMLKLFIDSGICMASTISDEAILAKYTELKSAHEATKESSDK